MAKANKSVRLKDDDEADMGIGTMILFIAMVLVAAIAATLLISTAQQLNQQAQETGTLAQAEVATHIQVVNIEGHIDNDPAASAAGKIDLIGIKIKLAAGSPVVNLDNVVIELSDGTTDVSLTFGGDAADDDAVGNVSLCTGSVFSCDEIRDPMGTFDATTNAHYISSGAIIKLWVNLDGDGNPTTGTSQELGSQAHIDMKIFPKHGVATYEAFTTPDGFTTTVVQLE